MIYIENSTENQNIYIPKKGNEEIRVSKIYQDKTIEVSGPGEYNVYPDPGYIALSSVKVIVK